MHLRRVFIEKYGPLLTLVQLATINQRSAEGLRVSLRSNTPLSAAINACRIKLGRRIYFKTGPIAAVLGLGDDKDGSNAA